MSNLVVGSPVFGFANLSLNTKIEKIYFAWVLQTETTFGPEHHVVDEDAFDYQCQHDEGQLPTLNVQVRNPRIGLLNPGRKRYAWVSVDNGSMVTPIFFGRLTGIPTNIFQEVVTLSFISQHPDWVYLRQQAAQPLKVRPFYDEVFFTPTTQDDPDAIISGWSGLWHSDRVTLAVEFSDYLVGEDGIEIFTEDEAFYDNMEMHFEQAPLTAFNIVGKVPWIQRETGLLDFGPGIVFSYTGNSIISGWPQPLTDLGGGWRVVASPNQNQMDMGGLNRAFTYSSSFSWQNNADEHAFGDDMSIEYSFSFPSAGGGLDDRYTISYESVIAYISEDPDFKDQPNSSAKATYAYVGLYKVAARFTARYQANRPRVESANITVTANTQEIITQAVNIPIEEKEEKSGVDVGNPLRKILNWLTVKNTTVLKGQVIYPGNPTIPGGTNLQICRVPGTTGNGAIPTFSPNAGEETVDNEVTWVSMGDDQGTNINDWTQNTYVPLGAMIRPTSGPWYDYYISQESNDIFGIPIINVGFLPDGNHYFMCVRSGITKEVNDDDPPPTLDGVPGTLISDGTVIWEAIDVTTNSLIYIPIGYPGARSYFTTDRGRWSLEYLIAVNRAHLRLRGRAVKISFDCSFERAIQLSCRKSATIHDRRLPGGVATGKIISYSFHANGDHGEFIGNVTIGCSIGFGNRVFTDPGEPVYVNEGYVNPGYQVYSGATSTLDGAGDDIKYAIPVMTGNDDGLTFPLTKEQVVIKDTMHGTLINQKGAIQIGINHMIEDYILSLVPTFANQAAIARNQYFSIENELSLKQNWIWYELEIRNLDRIFENQYKVQTSMLELTQGINLEAASL